MVDTLHLGAAVAGTILGARMAAQQGLFVFGGALSDRFGAKPMVLLGIGIRVIGLLVVGSSAHPAGLLIGVVLIGAAAALFAPAVEATNATYGKQLEDAGTLPRTELFAIEQVFSRVGTALGPMIGTALLFAPFIWTALAAAAIFAALLVAFAVVLPPEPAHEHGLTAPLGVGLLAPLKNRAFLALATPGSLYLGAQNLFYVLLPLHVGSRLVGYFYIGSALVVVLGQPLLRALTRNASLASALAGGFGVTSAAFVLPGLALMGEAPRRDSTLLIAAMIAWAILLQVGQMLIMPALRDAVARTAHETNLGSHFGMLSTIGGFLALALAWASGTVIDAGVQGTTVVWAGNAVVFLVAAVVMAIVVRRTQSSHRRE